MRRIQEKGGEIPAQGTMMESPGAGNIPGHSQHIMRHVEIYRQAAPGAANGLQSPNSARGVPRCVAKACRTRPAT